ncbi:hypothetical protein BDV19DRAFT_387885 [Aspergillus venezuelensis]
MVCYLIVDPDPRDINNYRVLNARKGFYVKFGDGRLERRYSVHNPLAYLYGTDRPLTLTDYAIARKMNAYWANFMKTGDTDGNGLTPWPSTTSDASVQWVGSDWSQVPVSSKEKARLF